jgi:ABC-type nitrate/sulfonate/bicarbonate transport system substrate-binding protein
MEQSVRSRQRFRLLFIAMVAAVAMLAAGCGANSPAGSSSGGGTGTLKVGFLYDAHAANVWTLDRCSDQGVKFELLNFKQFAEVQRAFQTGQIDVAAMGYQNLAQMVGNGFTNFKAVSGVYTGAEHITIRKGENIRTWGDLAGKKVGIPPNSFVEMLFRAGAEENGLDISKVNVVPFPGGGPPLLAALERGDIHAMVSWEPNSAKAEVQGIGEYPPFDIQQGSIGKATSVMYVSNQLLDSSREAVQALVSCMKERTDDLNANPDVWVKDLQEKTGLSKDVAETAIETGEMDINVYAESAEKIIQTFAQRGLVKDISSEVPQYIDYSFLQKATGKPQAELGGA